MSKGTAEALAKFRPLAPTDRVFTVLNEGRLSEAFRADLAKAEVDRAELFERGPSRRPIPVGGPTGLAPAGWSRRIFLHFRP